MDRPPYGYGAVFHGRVYPRPASAAFPHATAAAYPYSTAVFPSAHPYASRGGFNAAGRGRAASFGRPPFPARGPTFIGDAEGGMPSTSALWEASTRDAAFIGDGPPRLHDADSAHPYAASTAESSSRGRGGFNSAGRGREYPFFADERYGHDERYGQPSYYYAAAEGHYLGLGGPRGQPFPFNGAGSPAGETPDRRVSNHLGNRGSGSFNPTTALPGLYYYNAASTLEQPSPSSSSSFDFFHTSASRASEHPSATLPLLSAVKVQKVNRVNSYSIFQNIRSSLRARTGRLYIAMDMEYAANESTDISKFPLSSDIWYSHLREFVNGGDVVQLGFVFAFQATDTERVEAYQIDLQMDAGSGRYNQQSIDFLLEHQHDLDAHRDTGVLPEWVYADFIRHLPFGDDSVTWVTYHGDRDLPFLMKLAVNGGPGVLLPEERSLFLHQCRCLFPRMFDVRVLAQLLIPGYTGSLEDLSHKLCVQRIGEKHSAGSDALLTYSCFLKLVKVSTPEALAARAGLLSGLEQQEMSIRCSVPVTESAPYVFQVTDENFEDQSSKIHDILRSNFSIIGLQVVLPADTAEVVSCTDSGTAQLSYETMLSMVNRVARFEVNLCFLNAQGNIAYGRIWRFTIDSNDQTHRFARLLASSGATHNQNILWVMLHGARGIAALLRSFMAPVPLPDTYAKYILSRASCFPALFDLGLVADTSAKVPLLPTGCKGSIHHIASSLGVKAHLCDVITVVRCYMSLRDGGELERYVSSGLMEWCCPKCTANA